MSLFPTPEQQAFAEEKLQALGAQHKAHEAELDKLRTVIEKRGTRIVQLHMHIRQQRVEAAKLRNRIRELEAKLNQPQYPADMLGKPVTAAVSEFNYDMDAAPKGGKLLVLNHGNVATFAVLSDRNKRDFKAWAPMPKIRKDKR